MRSNKLSTVYKNLFENENELEYIQDDESFNPGSMRHKLEDDSRVSKAGFEFILSNNLKLPNDAFSPINKGEDDDKTSSPLTLNLGSNISNRKYLNELHNALFLIILWQASADKKPSSSGKTAYSSAKSLLKNYSSAGFGDISEEFFGKLLNLSGNFSVNLNDFLASGNTEFADVYTADNNTSWSLKMTQESGLGGQKISFFKLFNAFMKDKDSALKETNAGILHLEPSGQASNPCLKLNIYGPRTVEELRKFEEDINRLQFSYFDKDVDVTYQVIYPDNNFENNLDFDIKNENKKINNYEEYIQFQEEIANIKSQMDDIARNFNATDNSFKEIKKAIKDNNKLLKDINDEIIEKIHTEFGYYEGSESVTPNPKKFGSRERFKNIPLQDIPDKSLKTTLTERELVYIFGRRTYQIDIPSEKQINDSIDNWVNNNNDSEIKRPKDGDWVNSIISQLMGRGKVNDSYLKLFPFLLTAGGSEINKSRRSASYWSKFYRDIDDNDGEISSGVEEKEKKAALDSIRKGWNDLRNVVDNTLNDEENFKDYDQKYKRINWLGDLLSDKAKEIDSVDVVKNNKVSLEKVPDSELNKYQYDLEDSYGFWYDEEEEEEEASSAVKDLRSKLRSNSQRKSKIDLIKSKLKNYKDKKFESSRKSLSLKSIYLNEGMFHMMHPYEYHASNDYKLSDILLFIDQIEEGSLDISEKVDGQNIWFGFENGKATFGYSAKDLKVGFKNTEHLFGFKGDIETLGKISGLEKIIMTDHPAKKVFSDGVKIIDSMISSAYLYSEEMRQKIESIFEEGNFVVSAEIIHKEGPNQILYGENFIAPHYVMNKLDNSQDENKYNDLFSVLKTGEKHCINPNEFKILTRQQRDSLGDEISLFSSEEEKQKVVNTLRREYERKIQSVIEGTRLTSESSIKDFYKEKIRSLCDNPPNSNQQVELNEEELDKLTNYVGGASLKESGLSKVYNYKVILSSLNLNNAANRKIFFKNNITPLIELFFDFGIDVIRNLKTTVSSPERREESHSSIVDTNIYNIKKALLISRDFKNNFENIPEEEIQDLDYSKDVFSLLNTINLQVPKIKKTVQRVKNNENLSSNEEALRLICSSSIEGLVFKKKSSIDNSTLEMKLTGFFAPLNQLLNAIRFKVNSIPMLQNYLEKDGKIFSFSDKGTDIGDIENLLESRLILSLRHLKTLKEIYNPRTYGDDYPTEEEIEEFDISCVPMSAKPFTKGHLDLVKKACERSKEVFVVASITDRARSHENPVFGRSMEKVLFNKEDLIPSLEDKINDLGVCANKVTVVASTNPFIDVITIFGKDFFEEYMDLNKRYAILVGDEEDGKPYNEKMLDHLGEKLNVLYRQEGSERLSSGTQTREHLNTGLKFSEVITVLKSGKEKLQKNVDYLGQDEEHSDEYEEKLDMFSQNLPDEIYSDKEIRNIYNTISDDSHEEIVKSLEYEVPNKRVEKAIGKRNIKKLKDLYNLK